jgi:hypothetical protein
MNRIYQFIIIFVLTSSAAFATHLLGGEIRASQTSVQNYKVAVHLYFNTAEGQSAADAQTAVTVCFGDGRTADLQRVSLTRSTGEDYLVGVFEGSHTYSASGSYQISASVANRSTFLNLPNGNLTTLFLWTVVNTQFPNTTPILSHPPLYAGVKQVFSINLNPSTPDNDSISLALKVVSRPSPGTCGVRMEEASYFYPNDLTRTGTLKIDPSKKTLTWNAPERAGNYLYGFVVREWRDGVVISESYHESTIIVSDRSGETVQVPEYEPAGTLVTAVKPGTTTSSEISLRIEAYPIPTENYLTFKVYAKKRSLISVQLLNLQGQVVRETTSSEASVLYQDEFDLSRLNKGVYILRAATETHSVTQKVIR